MKRTIERLAESGVIRLPPMVDSEIINNLGLTSKVKLYVFDLDHKRDSFVVVAQLSPEFTARLVDRWQELEEAIVKNQPAVPHTLREALLLAANLEAKREEAEARALEAERTKALIGSKREAKAMATASAKARENEKLKIELGYSKKYATVKRMETDCGQKFNWRKLKSASVDVGIPPRDVFDSNYGTVKAYHESAWRKAYALDIPGA